MYELLEEKDEESLSRVGAESYNLPDDILPNFEKIQIDK